MNKNELLLDVRMAANIMNTNGKIACSAPFVSVMRFYPNVDIFRQAKRLSERPLDGLKVGRVDRLNLYFDPIDNGPAEERVDIIHFEYELLPPLVFVPAGGFFFYARLSQF